MEENEGEGKNEGGIRCQGEKLCRRERETLQHLRPQLPLFLSNVVQAAYFESLKKNRKKKNSSQSEDKEKDKKKKDWSTLRPDVRNIHLDPLFTFAENSNSSFKNR